VLSISPMRVSSWVRLGNAGAGCFELVVSSAIEERYAVVLRISQQLTARENNCQYPME